MVSVRKYSDGEFPASDGDCPRSTELVQSQPATRKRRSYAAAFADTPLKAGRSGLHAKSPHSPRLKKTKSVETILIDVSDEQDQPKKPRRKAASTRSQKRLLHKIDDVVEVPSPSTSKNVCRNRKSSLENGSTVNAMPATCADSQIEAEETFQWLISPVQPDKFFKELWERKPLLLRRHEEDYYGSLFSASDFDRIMRQYHLEYGVNLDVTSYKNGVRETHNPIGKVYPPLIWDFYQQGCSLRLLNPQTYSDAVWKLNSVLQERFGTFVGANVYLTPAGTQGFAPHWDDIDAFVLQLEGGKAWKVYGPRCEAEKLPRFSSPNFNQSDIGEPILETTLHAGDLLYIPRGFIHQAVALESCHSLHITLSACQTNTLGDFISKLLPLALEKAVKSSAELRQSLPTDYLHFMGSAHAEGVDDKRKRFSDQIRGLMHKFVDLAPIDEAADAMGKKFIHESLPPQFTEDDKKSSIHGHGEHWSTQRNSVAEINPLGLEDRVKLIRRHCVRLCKEEEDEDSIVLYHNVENSRIYKERELQRIPLLPEQVSGVEHLIQAYPNYVSVSDLALESDEQKLELASILYDKGLISTEEPLTLIED